MGIKENEFNSSSLYDRVKKLLVSYEWSDCSFSVCGKDFKAHKLILGISSPVFEAMFYGPLSSSNVIVITDIEPDIFQLLLNYMYTDKVEICSIEEAFELLYASRKYLLEQLSDMCIAFIQLNLSIDNVITILNYPEYMHDKALIFSAVKLFCEHAHYLLQEKKNVISPSCMKTILESNVMNIKEKDLINYVFAWTTVICEQNNIEKSIENRRNILLSSDLLKLLRFYTLTLNELQEVLLDSKNLLQPVESGYIKEIINGVKYDDDAYMNKILGSIFSPRTSLKIQWYLCHRSPLRSSTPIVIDSNSYSVEARIKTLKSIFITSLCIPTRLAPVLNFRSDTTKTYSEQMSVSIVDESDNNIVRFTNFMNTVEYGSIIDIELSEPCFIKKDKWYKVSFVWPQNSYINYSYVVEYRDRFYKDHRLSFEFEDLSLLPGNSGSFLCGLKYCV